MTIVDVYQTLLKQIKQFKPYAESAQRVAKQNQGIHGSYELLVNATRLVDACTKAQSELESKLRTFSK